MCVFIPAGGFEIALDDQAAVHGHLQGTLTGGARTHVLRLSAMGHRPKEISFGPGTSPPREIRLEGHTANDRGGEAQQASQPGRRTRPRRAARIDTGTWARFERCVYHPLRPGDD